MLSTLALPRLIATATRVTGAGAATLLVGLLLASAEPGVVRTATSPVAESSASLFDDDRGVSIFGAKTLLWPGRVESGCIAVGAASANVGDEVLLAATGVSGTLARELTLSVEAGDGGRSGDCGGFTGRTVWTGTLADLAASESGVSLGWDPGELPVRTFRINASSNTDDWAVGRSATADLVWRLMDGTAPDGVLRGPSTSGPTARPDVTLDASPLARIARRAVQAVLSTLRNAQYPIAAIVIALAFVLAEQWLERRDPKLMQAARTSRENECAFPDRFGPGTQDGLA